MTEPRKWLITGSAGFIGSNLAKTLLNNGQAVVGLDNFFSGFPRNIDRLERIGGGRFEFVEGSILDADKLEQAIQGCDVVVHLAAQVSVMRSFDLPYETLQINEEGFLAVHQAAVRNGVSRMVYASTCAVYGDNPALPLSETEMPRPLSPYAASKLGNENWAQSLAVKAPGLVTVGLRFFNVFGAWQDPHGGYAAVIPKWIDALLQNQPITVFGDGSATRDFCHVDNICHAIQLAAAPDFTPNYPCYNIGTGVESSLMDLYQQISAALQDYGVDLSGVVPQHAPPRSGDIVRSVGDIQRAQTDMGYRPLVSLTEGLRRIFAEVPPIKWQEAS